MSMKRLNMALFFIIGLLASCVEQKDDKSVMVDKLLREMSIDEKVAQMRVFHANLGISLDSSDRLVLSDAVKEKLKYGIAGIKNPGEHYPPERAAKLNNQLQKYIVEHTRLGIPAFFITESYNGVDAVGCTRFARPITLVSSWNRDLIYKIYDCMGREARLRGLHLTHSPEADIVRDPRFGRMSETFGEDTYLVTEMITNAVKGLQGDNAGLDSTHIGAVVKHFAAYAQVAGGRNFASIEISPRTLADEILPPFKAAVQRGGALGVMASHGDINGISCHANAELLTSVLREQWGFEGYVISDSNDIHRLYSFMRTAGSEEEAVIMALKAGMDVDLYSEQAYALLPKIVDKHPGLEAYIDKAVKRVLMTKAKLGLFKNPYTIAEEAKKVRDTSAIELARIADQESVILLKNNQSILPLNEKVKTIALVGPNVNKQTQEFFEKATNRDITFITEKGFAITNQQGKTDGDGDGDGSGEIVDVELTSRSVCEEGIERIMNVAAKADVVVLFVGGDQFTSREAFFNNALGDRADLDLAGYQNELIDKVSRLGKPVIGVLKHRRTLSATELVQKADALLDCWELSEFGDMAVADVIFGNVNPSGKLPVTVPRAIGQIPFHYSQKAINNKKGYLFVDNSPLYPFGFGLSYTNFEYSDLKLDRKTLTHGDSLVVAVNVTNSGERAGKEVVQLYVKDICGQVVRPEKELKDFKKVTLLPGEMKIIRFVIVPEMLQYTGISMKQVVDDGDFEVFVGGNSANLLSAKFSFEEL